MRSMEISHWYSFNGNARPSVMGFTISVRFWINLELRSTALLRLSPRYEWQSIAISSCIWTNITRSECGDQICKPRYASSLAGKTSGDFPQLLSLRRFPYAQTLRCSISSSRNSYVQSSGRSWLPNICPSNSSERSLSNTIESLPDAFPRVFRLRY